MLRLRLKSYRLQFRTYSKAIQTKNENFKLDQASNRVEKWSNNQAEKASKMVGPRFEQTDLAAQPNPMAAIELIHEEPIRKVETRIVSCAGGEGALGHPKVYINLDQGKATPCGYCGIRFQLDHHH